MLKTIYELLNPELRLPAGKTIRLIPYSILWSVACAVIYIIGALAIPEKIMEKIKQWAGEMAMRECTLVLKLVAKTVSAVDHLKYHRKG